MDAEPQTVALPETEAEDISAPAKKRGRPRGARNHVTRDLAAFIRDVAQPIPFLAKIVRGNRMRVGDPDKLGRAVYTYPTLTQRVQAATILADKILPSLKAAELTGKDGAALLPAAPADYRETSKAIIEIFRRAVPGGGVAVTEPGEASVTFSDPDLAKRVFPEGGHTPTASPANRASESPKPVEAPTEPQPVARGRFIVAPSGNRWCICRVGDPAPLEFRDTYPDAVKRGEELDRQGKR